MSIPIILEKPVSVFFTGLSMWHTSLLLRTVSQVCSSRTLFNPQHLCTTHNTYLLCHLFPKTVFVLIFLRSSFSCKDVAFWSILKKLNQYAVYPSVRPCFTVNDSAVIMETWLTTAVQIQKILTRDTQESLWHAFYFKPDCRTWCLLHVTFPALFGLEIKQKCKTITA